MTLAEIQQDTPYWQRLLRFAGFYHGKVDGIFGKQTASAEAKWYAEQAALLRGFGTLDKRSEENLQTIIPRVQLSLRSWLARAIPAAAERGYTLKVICGTRSYAEQDALYAQGRSKKGTKVTNAPAGHSNHNFGIAVDIGLFRSDGSYVEDDAPYDALARECPVSAPLEWGGSWKFHDSPHYQSTIYGDTTAAIRTRFNA